jgi:hypothetical protein
LKYAIDLRPDNIVPVIVEKGASDTTLWQGLLKPYRNSHMHIDVSGPADQISPRQIKALVDALRPLNDPSSASGPDYPSCSLSSCARATVVVTIFDSAARYVCIRKEFIMIYVTIS